MALWAYNVGQERQGPVPAAGTLPPGAAQRRPAVDASGAAPDEQAERTRRGLVRLAALVEQIGGERRDYPRSHRTRYGANRGIESLTDELERRDLLPVADLLLVDQDHDDRPELADAWGQPLVYFNHVTYALKQSWAVSEGHVPKVGAAKRLDGSYFAATRFQIWSAGGNGLNENGRGDDLVSWKGK